MRILLLVTIAVALSGCATLKSAPAPAREQTPQAAEERDVWWYARFAVAWPDKDAEPDWQLGTLIAHRVVAPVLESHRPNIRLWRFHRRAGDDAAGHQFSFIFYANVDTARDVYAALRSSSVLQALERAGRVQLKVDNLAAQSRRDVAATSDPNWSPELARAWPHYIMGVSEMWLALIRQYAADEPLATEEDIQALEVAYRKVSSRLDETWASEGQHAFLHHLNAIFGYQPLIVTERRRVRF